MSSCFNTTFVTVLFLQYVTLLRKKQGFNTTFVTVLSYKQQSKVLHTIVSIQLLLLFYVYETRRNTILCVVSIQLLLLFYQELLPTKSISGGFNTTFVTVLYATRRIVKGFIPFQYNFCYCSMGFCEFTGFNIIVSIQLLLLFYKQELEAETHNLMFQYNFCYCSMLGSNARLTLASAFQYNFCYCSISRGWHRIGF